MKYPFKHAVVFVVGITIPLQLHARPSIASIQGLVQNGQSVTIKGSGFGLKSPAAPVCFDNFESGALGSQLNGKKPVIGAAYGACHSPEQVVYSNDKNPANSQKVCKFTWRAGTNSQADLVMPIDGPEFYIHYKRYMVPSPNPIQECNVKQFYVTVDKNGPGNGAGMLIVPGGSSGWAYYNNSGQISDQTGLPKGGESFAETNNKWMTWEVWDRLNQPYTSKNGSVHVWLNSKLIMQSDACKQINEAEDFSQFWLGEMYQQPSGSAAYCYYDDVYLDKTRARVMIADSPLLSTSTRREIQLPTVWSDGSITFTVHQGEFTKGDFAYIFVMNADGEATPVGSRAIVGQEASSMVRTNPFLGTQKTATRIHWVNVLGRNVTAGPMIGFNGKRVIVSQSR